MKITTEQFLKIMKLKDPDINKCIHCGGEVGYLVDDDGISLAEWLVAFNPTYQISCYVGVCSNCYTTRNIIVTKIKDMLKSEQESK